VGVEGFKIDKEWVEFMEKDLLLKFIKDFNLNNNFYKIEYRIESFTIM